jgi:hypothetical protein
MHRAINHYMDKIVFINQWPSHLTKDIVNAFEKMVDDIALIAGYISESGSPLNSNVKVNRIIKYNKKNILSRAFTWIIATIQIIFLVNTKYRKHHLFLTSNPPTSTFIPLFCPNKYSVQILDIYPDALVAGKFISQRSWLNRFWINQNRKYFGRARNVYTITEGMAQTISQYCNREKIRVIAQWPSTDGMNLIGRSENRFILEHGLKDQFIVMYSGNIGLGHHVTTLVEAANILRDIKEIVFVIIGEGWNKPAVEKLINDYELSNCLVLPFQPSHIFKHSSQAADIGVVSVSKELAMLSVPIKTYNLINNNIPLLGITEGDSELASLISKHDIGKYFAPNQVKKISDFILSLKADKELIIRYKKNLSECSVNFTSKNAISYINCFTE